LRADELFYGARQIKFTIFDKNLPVVSYLSLFGNLPLSYPAIKNA
jgi:hypothetical protein